MKSFARDGCSWDHCILLLGIIMKIKVTHKNHFCLEIRFWKLPRSHLSSDTPSSNSFIPLWWASTAQERFSDPSFFSFLMINRRMLKNLSKLNSWSVTIFWLLPSLRANKRKEMSIFQGNDKSGISWSIRIKTCSIIQKKPTSILDLILNL